ncbi:hypothetical protein SELMODRAFT_167445 [Selaginella moellendorffii]|uniref:Caleosin n=1 Tax=Selaginella moellendorffii TaxID=88036 RepID=D8R120_SELML|nr:peroxygenase 2 [Selaginella moellendorffii]EFJ33827.1 hypothetical protein SELMODRAFT_167445 [Selaginella moellendorffii]|eukprot:XP_002964989.1 peroxygenase 2 [Selaginella moellendorffii]
MAMEARKREALETTADGAPVTKEHRVEAKDYDRIPKPHVPRALFAVDNDHPLGSPDHDHSGLSVLQQHVAFFDRNKDGIVYPWETFQGFRAIGFNFVLAFIGMLFINGSMSYATLESWIPSPLFPIYIKNIHKAMHGSDTGIYDHEGRFVPANFEQLFDKYATHADRMSYKEIIAMTQGQRDAFDLFGWTANKLEWTATYWILGEKGYMSKDAIRAVYDGSVFEYLEKQHKHQQKLQ